MDPQMMFGFKAFSALLLAVPAFAHVRMTSISVNGGAPVTDSVRLPPSNSPVTDVTSDDLICNVNGANPMPGITSIPAGATIGAQWDQGAHPGPNLVYMAKVDNATTSTITGLSWTKISQQGIVNSALVANAGGWSSPLPTGLYEFTIPSEIPSGQYLLRVETIGLHVASTYPGAQFYIGCVQIQVTNGGSGTPTGVSFPGAYAGSDPGITIDIYYPVPTTYTFPGGPVWPDGSTQNDNDAGDWSS
ncbi:lytic polysaccharide monooxygenase [Sphaerobolus stellatus SS14]|uniref:AA9 family lytic polysaccharide monooxygenase n=1 Tax=Sphaerobolus stellatus (strain SS14) TaxID=990650 RepID=A0A0C9TWY2_SPHS4|nr:lytic polysaccharide monooxygenase [Sphaerobolus stellatus SS14]